MKNQRHLYPLVFWLALPVYTYFIPPVHIQAFFAFYALFFAGAYTSLRLRFDKNTSLLWSSAAYTYLLLRQFRLDTLLTLILFVCVVLCVQLYLHPPSRRRFGK